MVDKLLGVRAREIYTRGIIIRCANYNNARIKSYLTYNVQNVSNSSCKPLKGVD